MGIFSSKYKTYVDTSTVRLVPDEQIPDVGRNSMIEAVLKDQSVSSVLTENLLNDATGKYQRAYAYAKSGDYYYGLPDATVLTNGRGATDVINAIETETGETITVEYVEFAPINNVHMGWQELYNTLQYDRTSNEIKSLSSQVGFSVYLDRIVPVFRLDADTEPDVGAWAEWGESSISGWTPEREYNNTYNSYLSTLYKVDLLFTDSVEIHYVWLDSNDTIQRGTSVVDLSSYDGEQEYFQVRYTYTDAQLVVQTRHWTYLPGSGTYPNLDQVYGFDYVDPGSYFPFVIFRRDGENRADPAYHGTQEFQSTQKLLSYYGMDFEAVSESIHQNPDINDVDQAVLLMGVPANSTNQLDMAYLFEFFNRLNEDTPFSEVESNPYKVSVTVPSWAQKDFDPLNPVVVEVPRASYAVVFQDADFKMTLSYGGIIKRTRSGSIGAVGSFSSTQTTTQYSTSFYNTAEDGFLTHLPERSSGINRVYRKQVAHNFYEEILVIDPSMRYTINAGKGVVAHANEDKLIIPLDRELCNKFSQLEKSQLYPRSLHFVFNSRVKVKLEWYETTFFKGLLTFAVVVVAIITGGTGSILSSFVTAATAGVAALSLFILKLVVYRFIFDYSFRLLIKEIGAKAAFTIAILGVAAGLSASQGLIPDITSTFSPNLLQASTGLIRSISGQTQEDFENLLKQSEDFELIKQEKLSELEQANSLLTQKVTLDPFTVFGEAPSQYFDRTAHGGNIGTVGIEYIESYVDMSLTLPDINDTLGGIHV